VWWIGMDRAQGTYQSDWNQLTAEERTRADRFRSDDDRLRFVACRAVLRRLLAACLTTAPTEVRLVEETYGKLRLADPHASPKWTFNVAHSGRLGCVALGLARPIGVDVEAPRQPVNLDLMCSKILSENEMQQYRRVASEDRLPTFLRLWTLKEAVAKATGWGLRLPLAEIEIDLRSPGRLVAVPARFGEASEFFLQELATPQPGYPAAIAVQTDRVPRLRYGEWPGEATLVIRDSVFARQESIDPGDRTDPSMR